MTPVSRRLRNHLPPVLIAIAAVVLAAAPAAPAAVHFKPGARSLGDDLFPQIGNGGYDALRYSINLHYDPRNNRLLHGTRSTMYATATQDLESFTLDFQDLRVGRVIVNGRPAEFKQIRARPRLSKNPAVTQPMKLLVKPRKGIRAGHSLDVTVRYEGTPKAFTDADESIEGWVRACSEPGRCDGSFTVNEPLGAQGWFPSNNYMADKAQFRTAITVPATYVALGVGKLRSREPSSPGNRTWVWREGDPTATYLTSATVGRFDYSRTRLTLSSFRRLQIYLAIDSAGSTARKQAIRDKAARIPEMTDFLTGLFGPYPFDSTGLVADWVPRVGYALENQTKPHFAGGKDGPSVGTLELVHELAHQWMGDSVSPATWHEIWFNEGWATIAETLFDARVEGGQAPEDFFADVYSAPAARWTPAPAVLDHDPADLFAGFPVYDRPAAMLEGYREIVGEARFEALAHDLLQRHGYGTITARQFVALAKRSSGLAGADLKRLGAYFHQWLYVPRKPSLTPADFPAPGP